MSVEQKELDRLMAQYDRESRAYPQGKIDQPKLTSLENLQKRIRKLEEKLRSTSRR